MMEVSSRVRNVTNAKLPSTSTRLRPVRYSRSLELGELAVSRIAFRSVAMMNLASPKGGILIEKGSTTTGLKYFRSQSYL
jgi:hypothetical protein